MEPIEITLENHYLGNRWQGISSIGPILINGIQPQNPLERVVMTLKNKSCISFNLDSNTGSRDAPIVIADADTWYVVIPEVNDFVTKEGYWDWDMDFYESGNSAPLTFYKGRLNVIKNI